MITQQFHNVNNASLKFNLSTYLPSFAASRISGMVGNRSTISKPFLFQDLVNSKIDLRVTPGKMSPRSKGGVINSVVPVSLFFNRKKIF